MERRFYGVFDALAERQTRGETFREILDGATNDELVAALAVAGGRDPVAANAIATELLNRLRRASFLGAFLVSLTMAVTVYILDLVYTGTPLFLETGIRARLLLSFSLIATLISLVSFLVWRGSFRRLRLALMTRVRAY